MSAAIRAPCVLVPLGPALAGPHTRVSPMPPRGPGLCPLDGYPVGLTGWAADSCDVNVAELGQKERRVERVQLETDRQRIVGDVTLPPEGYQSRFSDSLNRVDITFIPLVNAEISSIMGGDGE